MNNKSGRHWIIVLFMCCLSASSIGLCTNSVGVFYVPVSEDLGVLKGTFAMHATLSSLATAAVSLFAAGMMKKYPYKRILLAGVLAASASTFLMGFSGSIWEFYVLGIIRGAAVGVYGMVPVTIVITNWFVEKHGMATSIALSFSGLSGAIFSPLLSHWISVYGWRDTYMLMAAAALVLTVPALICPWSAVPEDQGLLPYGYGKEERRREKEKGERMNKRSVIFVCMCIFTVLHTSITGISQHLSGMAISVGLNAAVGASMISLAMFGNISSKLIIGFLSDLMNPVRAGAVMIAVNMASLCSLYSGMGTGSVPVLLVSSFVFGSVYSVATVGLPLLTRHFFGNENYSDAYSVIGFLTNAGSSVSLALIGYACDFTGNYRIVIVTALAFHALNLMMLTAAAARHNKKRGG